MVDYDTLNEEARRRSREHQLNVVRAVAGACSGSCKCGWKSDLATYREIQADYQAHVGKMTAYG